LLDFLTFEDLNKRFPLIFLLKRFPLIFMEINLKILANRESRKPSRDRYVRFAKLHRVCAGSCLHKVEYSNGLMV